MDTHTSDPFLSDSRPADLGSHGDGQPGGASQTHTHFGASSMPSTAAATNALASTGGQPIQARGHAVDPFLQSSTGPEAHTQYPNQQGLQNPQGYWANQGMTANHPVGAGGYIQPNQPTTNVFVGGQQQDPRYQGYPGGQVPASLQGYNGASMPGQLMQSMPGQTGFGQGPRMFM